MKGKENTKRFYIKKGIRKCLISIAEIKNIGHTESDYNAGKFIEISEKQAEFLENNPFASFSEIMNMEILPMPVPVEIPIEERYKALVESKIRAKYSISEEFAIQRKRDTEPDKFAEYDIFCEECKAEAKLELGLN